MKKRFESFLIWYVPVSVISVIIASVWLPAWAKYLGQEVAAGRSVEFGIFYSLIVTFSGSIHKLVAAIWLWREHKREEGRFILWALFGFFSGIWAVAFHIGLSIFDEIKTDKAEHKDT